MKEVVLANVYPHFIAWGVIGDNGCWYYKWQSDDAIKRGVPVEKIHCGFIYFTPIVKLRIKQ